MLCALIPIALIIELLQEIVEHAINANEVHARHGDDGTTLGHNAHDSPMRASPGKVLPPSRCWPALKARHLERLDKFGPLKTQVVSQPCCH